MLENGKYTYQTRHPLSLCMSLAGRQCLNQAQVHRQVQQVQFKFPSAQGQQRSEPPKGHVLHLLEGGHTTISLHMHKHAEFSVFLFLFGFFSISFLFSLFSFFLYFLCYHHIALTFHLLPSYYHISLTFHLLPPHHLLSPHPKLKVAICL